MKLLIQIFLLLSLFTSYLTALEVEYDKNYLKKLNTAIHEQLRPTKRPTIFSLIKSDEKLPVRSFEKKKLHTLLSECEQYVPSDNKDDGVYLNCSIKKLAENNQWTVTEVIYNASGSDNGWGVLLVENKQEDQWFSFYNIPVGGQKVQLHTPKSLELVGDVLRGAFCTECDTGGGAYKSFEIDLSSFWVNPSHEYRFGNYCIKSLYKGAIAPLVTSHSEEASMFQSRIRSRMQEGVNFAGHYVVTEIGCGTGCQTHIIVDAKTGKVVDSRYSRAGAEYTANSRLFIVNSDPYCLTEQEICEQQYLIMKKGKLHKVNENDKCY